MYLLQPKVYIFSYVLKEVGRIQVENLSSNTHLNEKNLPEIHYDQECHFHHYLLVPTSPLSLQR